MANKFILVTKDELLSKQTYLAQAFGYPKDQQKVIVPEHEVFKVLERFSHQQQFHIKLLHDTEDISD